MASVTQFNISVLCNEVKYWRRFTKNDLYFIYLFNQILHDFFGEKIQVAKYDFSN